MTESESKKPKMSSLEQLRASGTLVVADTGDFEAISKFKPRNVQIQLLESSCEM